MICQQCKEEDKKSRVTPGLSMKTLLYCPAYFDEDGKYHHHDWNTTTTEYRCTNGHQWTGKSSGLCWCGWGKDNDRSIY